MNEANQLHRADDLRNHAACSAGGRASLVRRSSATHWAKMMRLCTMILFALISTSSILLGSEMTVTAEEKVAESELIALGQIIGIERGTIRQVKGYHGRRQEMAIRFEIKQLLLGEASSKIAIHVYSTYYIEDGAVHASTAGFSGNGLVKDERYLAYLIRRDGRYYLASDSNQYFEHVDDANNRIRADGQVGEYVNLHKKLARVSKLAKRKIQSNRAANAPSPQR